MELHSCLYCDAQTKEEKCQNCKGQTVYCLCCLIEIKYRPKIIYSGQYCRECAQRVEQILGDIRVSHDSYLSVTYQKDGEQFKRCYPVLAEEQEERGYPRSKEISDLEKYTLPEAETLSGKIEHFVQM